jgi:hypothetical protein
VQADDLRRTIGEGVVAARGALARVVGDELERLRQQQYHSLLARLRYESGEMITFGNEGTPTETIGFRGGEFVSR